MRLKATSLIEVAISLLVASIIFSGVWSTVRTLDERRARIQIEETLREVSEAAACYAYQKGFLPLPEGVEDSSEEEKLRLRGPVPWKELGMRAEPRVRGRPFTWVVSATAVRKLGWQYSEVSHQLHTLPSFWADPRHATFARPKWSDAEECTIQTPDSPRFSHLTPLPHPLTWLSEPLMRLYQLETQVGLWDSVEKQEVAPMGAWVGNLSERDLSSVVLAGMKARRLWINEPVLAVAYEPEETEDQLKVEGRHVMIWTRYNLLRLAGYCDRLVYRHPGYEWRESLYGKKINALAAWRRWGEGMRAFDSHEVFYLCKESQLMSALETGELVEERLDHLIKWAGGVAVREGKMVVLCPRKDFQDQLPSFYFAEWLKAILLMEGLQPLRINSRGRIVPATGLDFRQELLLWSKSIENTISVLEGLVEDELIKLPGHVQKV